MDDLGHYMLRCSELKAERDELAARILDARGLLARLRDDLDKYALPGWVATEVDDARAVLAEEPVR